MLCKQFYRQNDFHLSDLRLENTDNDNSFANKFLGEFVMNWLLVFILITVLVATFIPTPKSEESNDNLSC